MNTRQRKIIGFTLLKHWHTIKGKLLSFPADCLGLKKMLKEFGMNAMPPDVLFRGEMGRKLFFQQIEFG